MTRCLTFASVALLALSLGEACLAPPGPRIVPASGVAGASCPSMTEPRRKGENPFHGVCFAVDSDSTARRYADSWKETLPADAVLMEKIAGQPTAAWMGNWNPDIERDVFGYVRKRAKAGGLPVMIFYNLPFRDCGQYSAGGVSSTDKYKSWIRSAADGIGKMRAVVVLEPDGLPMLTKCLNPEQQKERLELIHFAVDTLMALPGAGVYIDAGHSAWATVDEMVPRLKAAGIDRADGFSLNISNYQATKNLIAYGHELSKRLGGKHFILDTARNGNGPPEGFSGDDERAWCNPDGRALGARPTTNTGDPLIDAFYWLKPPGESDGRCNKGPDAGTFWPEHALELARKAAW